MILISSYLCKSGLEHIFLRKSGLNDNNFEEIAIMKFEKAIKGNFNQTNEMFGKRAGKQSAAITLFSICWTKVRRINLWKSFDLDYVLHKGDSVQGYESE